MQTLSFVKFRLSKIKGRRPEFVAGHGQTLTPAPRPSLRARSGPTGFALARLPLPGINGVPEVVGCDARQNIDCVALHRLPVAVRVQETGIVFPDTANDRLEAREQGIREVPTGV